MASGSFPPQTASAPNFDTLSEVVNSVISSRSFSVKQLLRFAATGDDEDVQRAFTLHAEELATQLGSFQNYVASRLTSQSGGGTEHLAGVSVDVTNSESAVAEEQTLHHVLAAYTWSTGFVAADEVVASIALSNRDAELTALAKTIQDQDRRAVDKYWHFLSTRTKLAYNMLTLSEVDPAVETKLADDRLMS